MNSIGAMRWILWLSACHKGLKNAFLDLSDSGQMVSAIFTFRKSARRS